MAPIKKIMVAVAFCEHSAGLLTYATGLAERLEAELLIANIINVRDVEAIGSIAAMGYEIDSEHYVSGIKEERRKALSEILAKVSFPADKMRAIFQIGHPVDELLKIVMREKVDLMVMGIKGRSDLEHMLVGSVAEKIFRRSPVPILSYRDPKSVERLKKHIDIK
jgi:nucleotide-binding universal stress UspA family protein